MYTRKYIELISDSQLHIINVLESTRLPLIILQRGY